MFSEHKITYENKQHVLYLFIQQIECSVNLVKDIFEYLHEDVLLDWSYDYLDTQDVSFRGNHVKIVSGSTIVRDLEFPFYMRKVVPVSEGKIIQLGDFANGKRRCS